MFKVEITKPAMKDLKKLDKPQQKMILSWISKHLEGCPDPRALGKPLTANHRGKWRYRVGDYRILAMIEDDRVKILVLSVGHRREVYRR